MKKINAMIIDPNGERVLKMEKIGNSLKSLKTIVGGNLENTHRWKTDETYEKESGIVSFDLYTDDEGKLKDFNCAFILVNKEGEQISSVLVGNGVIVGTNISGETVSADPNEMIKIVKVKSIKKGEQNWEKIEEAINNEISGGVIWNR